MYTKLKSSCQSPHTLLVIGISSQCSICSINVANINPALPNHFPAPKCKSYSRAYGVRAIPVKARLRCSLYFYWDRRHFSFVWYIHLLIYIYTYIQPVRPRLKHSMYVPHLKKCLICQGWHWSLYFSLHGHMCTHAWYAFFPTIIFPLCAFPCLLSSDF